MVEEDANHHKLRTYKMEGTWYCDLKWRVADPLGGYYLIATGTGLTSDIAVANAWAAYHHELENQEMRRRLDKVKEATKWSDVEST